MARPARADGGGGAHRAAVAATPRRHRSSAVQAPPCSGAVARPARRQQPVAAQGPTELVPEEPAAALAPLRVRWRAWPAPQHVRGARWRIARRARRRCRDETSLFHVKRALLVAGLYPFHVKPRNAVQAGPLGLPDTAPRRSRDGRASRVVDVAGQGGRPADRRTHRRRRSTTRRLCSCTSRRCVSRETRNGDAAAPPWGTQSVSLPVCEPPHGERARRERQRRS